jgi:hypothetical protein
MKQGLKYILLLIFFACLFNNASAQIPGYKGRRHIIDFNYTPVIYYPINFRSYTKGYEDWDILHRFGFTYNYVTSRRRTVGFKYAYTGSTTKGEIMGYAYNISNTVKGTSEVGIKQHRFGLLSQKYYSGGAPAPLGTYIGLEFGFSIVQVFDNDRKMYREGEKVAKGLYLTTLQPGLFYNFGYRRGLGDHMMIDLSADFNVLYLFYLMSAPRKNVEQAEDGDLNIQYLRNKHLARGYYYNSSLGNFTLTLSFVP